MPERDYIQVSLDRDGPYWLKKKRQFEKYEAKTPINQNPQLLQQLKKEYSQNLLLKQKELQQSILTIRREGEEINNNCS